MNRSRISKIALLIVTVILLSNTAAISRDYQDSWILEGLEVSFLLFVVTYAIAFFSERRTSWLVTLAIIGRFMFLLVPNLKYAWFQGTAGDQQTQYALANNVYDKGHIYSGVIYGSTPLIHLAFSIFSMILGMPVVDSIKYLPVLLSPVYPLLTFIIIKSMKFSHRTTLLKYGLFISSIPLNLQAYIVTGSQFGVLLAFLTLSSLVLLLQKNDRRYWFIFIFLVFALGATHSITSTFFTIFLFSTMMFQKIFYFQLKNFLKAPIVLAATSISAAWLMFQASAALRAMSTTIFFAVPGGTTPGSEFVPSRFFELAQADILGGIRALLVYYGADVFLLLLSLGGLTILFKKRKELNGLSKFILLFGGLVVLSIPFAAVLKVGTFRTVYFASPLLLVFSSILVFHFGRRRAWIPLAIFSLMIILAPLELYSCQPLIPSANIIDENLPVTEPIDYVNQVTSIYQRQMIIFARNHIRGRIASDVLTKNQIIGLTGYNFSNEHLIVYYPLDTRQPEQRYDFFLIHLHGKSGTFGEQAEVRVQSLILDSIYNSSIVYTNGESYALLPRLPHVGD